jgi:hypothetical protein
MYGLNVVSDVPLSGLPAASWRDAAPDVEIVWPGTEDLCRLPTDAPTAALQCSHGTTILTRYDDERGSWLRHRSFGTFNIAADGTQIAVYPRAGVESSMLDGTLTSQVPIFLSHLQKSPSLHASSVVTDDGAAIFLGPKGQGKSTMAALFLRNGAALLADDTVPVRINGGVAYGVPGLPSMKLWPQAAAHTLGIHERLPAVAPNHDKGYLSLDERHRFAQEPAPIRAIYALERRDPALFEHGPITVRRLSGRDSLALLLSHTSLRSLLRPIEFASLIRSYSALVATHQVRILEYPDGFDYQAAVHAAVSADMAQP